MSRAIPADQWDRPRREVRTSDGAVGTFAADAEVALRRQTYEEWVGKISQQRPFGHEAVPTRAAPLSWTPWDRPLAERTVALVTTGGVHLRAQEPFAIFDEAGDPTSRAIPGHVDARGLAVTHSHYATDDAVRDPNVMFPLDRLRELAADRIIGAASPLHFGFMGFIPDPKRLVAEIAPAAAAELRDRGVDTVVLTAG